MGSVVGCYGFKSRFVFKKRGLKILIFNLLLLLCACVCVRALVTQCTCEEQRIYHLVELILSSHLYREEVLGGSNSGRWFYAASTFTH